MVVVVVVVDTDDEDDDKDDDNVDDDDKARRPLAADSIGVVAWCSSGSDARKRDASKTALDAERCGDGGAIATTDGVELVAAAAAVAVTVVVLVVLGVAMTIVG